MGSGRQTCKVCHRPDKFNFHVPDEVWARVVPSRYRKLVVCLACFDDFAAEAGIEYARFLTEVYFAGERASLIMRVFRASG